MKALLPLVLLAAGCHPRDVLPDKFTIQAPLESLDADRAVVGLHFNIPNP